MRPDDRPYPDPPTQAGDAREWVRFEIDPAATMLPGAARPEPAPATARSPAEADEIAPLDPDRATEEPERRSPVREPRVPPFGLLGSLGVHLLPLIFLVSWTSTPAEIAAPIPVQLVIEQPPPPPPAPPAPPAAKRPPPGRLASETMGEPAKAKEPAVTPEPPSAKPPEPQVAALVPPPPLKPPPPASRPKAEPTVERFAPRPRAAPRDVRVPGPAATRDEYLAYLVMLTRRHLDMLPLSFVGSRRGQTTLAIRVLDDGTIARIAVAQGSGYPDIDERIERMVAAVQRFPPLPQWFQGSSMDLHFRLRFPEALER